MMAVYGGVAMTGQGMKSPSNMTVIIIRVFVLILVGRVHFTMLVDNGRSGVNPA
jgi:hypothetical protein